MARWAQMNGHGILMDELENIPDVVHGKSSTGLEVFMCTYIVSFAICF